MNKFGRKLLTVLLTGICLDFAVQAGPVTLPTSGWVTEPFTLMSNGSMFPDAYTISSTGNLLVSGYYVSGDYYKVFVNGNLALTTTQVGPINVDYGDRTPSQYADPGSAFASGLFSTGILGVHVGDTVTIFDMYAPSGVGEAGVAQVGAIQATPEPGSFLLLAAGLMFLIRLAQRRNSKDAFDPGATT